MIATFPQGPVETPPIVAEFAAGRAVKAVWKNEVGGLTFQVGAGAARQFLKWTPHGSGIDLGAEVLRLRWAGAFAAVPEVLAQGGDAEGSWIVTAGLPGRSAVDGVEPATAVRAIGEGLRALHEHLPVGDCPFSWTGQDRLELARARAEQGRIDPAEWHPDLAGFGGDVDRVLDVLAQVPPFDGGPVVGHGDACAPNTLVGEDGRWSGHVDLGRLGVADRWADLAIATWSTTWNYGPGWEQPLLDAYGTDADAERIRYYRLLWELAG